MADKVELVVFDWAGTTVDFGSSAPTEVFSEVFSEAGIELSRSEINAPMGMEKKDHIRSLLSSENGNRQWLEKNGRPWNEEDVEDLYQRFEAVLRKMVGDHSAPLQGVTETVAELRKRGLRIGSTTGYNSDIMSIVAEKAGEFGYQADCIVTPDVTGIGRPSPFMLFECMRRFGIYPARRVVKVGDTAADIAEGRNAGAWTVGILRGSNLMGLTEEEYQAAGEEELSRIREAAAEKYREAGADMVIGSIEELPAAIEEINSRMDREAGR